MRLGSPPGGLEAKSWRDGESGRETLVHSALAVVGLRTRKEAKACESRHGSSGRESFAGQLQRDASSV
jgi:hypothetical protein